MIYLVSKQQKLFKSDSYKYISPEEAIALLSKEKLLGADTETQGMNPYTKQLLTIQLGTEDFQVVWDCTTVDIQLLKPMLENPDIKTIWWNASFDLKFLYHQRIIPINVYDGMLAEKLMWLGYPPGYHSMSLKEAAYNYCNVELDKSVRGNIIKYGLTEDVIIYAARDVEYEIPIYNAQQKLLAEKDLLKAIEFENEFVKVLAYIEYCGVKLDAEKWKAKMDKDEARANSALAALNNWLIDFYNEHKIKDNYILYNNEEIYFPYVYRNLQGDLWDGFDTSPKCNLNWGSSKQLIPLFQLLGFNLESFDKATKTKKLSVEAKIIGAQKDVCSIAPLYVEYKKAEKIVSTYGQNFLNAINPVSGRIHASFNQLMDTGRLSCGGGESQVNVQNIPHDAESRACFVAESGNSWISSDYSGQEANITASVSEDPTMIGLLASGGDLHSEVARACWPELLGNLTDKEVKERYKDYRQDAKGIEFSVFYGGDANTIKANKGFDLKTAKRIYDNFMERFPGIAAYQAYCRKEVMDKGYILLNPVTRHKAYIYDYDDVIKPMLEKTKDPEFWAYYNEMKKADPHCDTVQNYAKFRARKSASEKQSINYRSFVCGIV